MGKPGKYDWVTHEIARGAPGGRRFVKKLEELLDELSGAQLLAIPGIFEVVSKHLEVFDALDEEEREDDEAS